MRFHHIIVFVLLVGVTGMSEASGRAQFAPESALVNAPDKDRPYARGPDRRLERNNDRRDDRRDNRRHDRRDDSRDDRRQDRREDRWDDRRDERWERYVKYRIGVRLLTLPARYTRIYVGPTVYYYADGVYLVAKGGGYVVVGAPIGARVRVMPYGFRSFWIGPRRYFFVNSTYYVYAPGTRDYVVVAAPSGADEAVEKLTPTPIVYPAQGQSEEQIDQDRYECHQFAMQESNFDPTRAQAESVSEQNLYNRALTACLEGRGYSVQ